MWIHEDVFLVSDWFLDKKDQFISAPSKEAIVALPRCDSPVSSLVPLAQATMAPMLGWEVIPAIESTWRWKPTQEID